MTPRPADGNMSEVIIPISLTLQEALGEVRRWRRSRVIQDTTLTFGTQALILNTNLGHDMLSSVAFEFSIHRGGHIFTEVKIISLMLTTVLSSAVQSVLFVLWVLALASFSFIFLARAYIRWKQGRLRSHFLGFRNLLEWGIILWGWMVFGMFVLERSMITSLKDDIQEYRNLRLLTPSQDHYDMDISAVRKFLSTASTLTDLTMWTQ